MKKAVYLYSAVLKAVSLLEFKRRKFKPAQQSIEMHAVIFRLVLQSTNLFYVDVVCSRD